MDARLNRNGDKQTHHLRKSKLQLLHPECTKPLYSLVQQQARELRNLADGKAIFCPLCSAILLLKDLQILLYL